MENVHNLSHALFQYESQVVVLFFLQINKSMKKKNVFEQIIHVWEQGSENR